MKKMLLQSSSLALGLVVVVLGIMVLIGKPAFLPFLIGAAVLLLVVMALMARGRRAAK